MEGQKKNNFKLDFEVHWEFSVVGWGYEEW
jgi:hypothetical protein